MQRTHTRFRSGSRAESERAATHGRSASGWKQEWLEADATDLREGEHATATRTRRALIVLGPIGLLAALLVAVFPLTPGFSPADTVAVAVAAAVTAAAVVAIVPAGDRLARGLPQSGAGDLLVFAVGLLSAGAAAIHFAVAKSHFEEYGLFGVFFVGSAIAQLVWPVWLLLRCWPPLLLLGAVGNALIVALWAVDRLWGLPLGPAPWKPDPVGFGDSAASAFELLLALGCVTLLARGRGLPLTRANAFALTLAVVGVTALSLLSVLGVGSSFLTPTA